MKTWKLMICVWAMVAGLSHAVTIPLVNGGFETPHVDAWTVVTPGQVPGWTWGSNYVALTLGGTEGTQHCYFSTGNSRLMQTVTGIAQPNTTYTLMIDAKGNEVTDQVQLGLVFDTGSYYENTDAGAGPWATYTMVFTTPATVSAGSDLRIDLCGINSAGGGQTDIELDNVRLSQSPIPEPAALTLLGLGALALFRRRRS